MSGDGPGPAPRSGHTFTTLGDRFLVFGGCGRVAGELFWGAAQNQFELTIKSPWCINLVGKACAFNDLHELDTSDSEEYKWREITLKQEGAPPPRARHAAIAVRPFCV